MTRRLLGRSPLFLAAACGPSPAGSSAGPGADAESPARADAAASDPTDTDAGADPPPPAPFRNPLDGGPDPFLIYHDSHYYLATTQGDAVRMKKAASLADLAIAPATTIWQDPDPSRNQHLWAPSFYRFSGHWYVYYTADDGTDDNHRIYVIESAGDDPFGPYHFKAKLEPPGATGVFAIDPVVLEQATGLAGPRVYLPAEGGCPEVREAPSVLQDAAGVFGPGSNGFFTSPDGSEDWIVYHAKNTSSYTYDFRTTRAQRITWVGDLPQLGTPVATGATQNLPAGDPGPGSIFINDDGRANGAGGVGFSDGWTAYRSCGVQCFLGDNHGSVRTGATATFHFTGAQIALYSVRDAGNGIAGFSIDGEPEVRRDLFAPIRQGEVPIYVSPLLEPGEHELRVRVTGDFSGGSTGPAISVDRAEVYIH